MQTCCLAPWFHKAICIICDLLNPQHSCTSQGDAERLTCDMASQPNGLFTCQQLEKTYGVHLEIMYAALGNGLPVVDPSTLSFCLSNPHPFKSEMT